MPSCAACQTPFSKERRGLKCTLCDERRVAEPAYYCDRACQKRHWPEHKAFHAKLAAELQKMDELGSNEDERVSLQNAFAEIQPIVTKTNKLLIQAEQARLRGDYREAVKLAKKAIAMDPDYPTSYMTLGVTYMTSGDFTNAVPPYLKAMELSDTGTEFNRKNGDHIWASCVSAVYLCLAQPLCTAPKPAWFTDGAGDVEQLKRMADRAVAGSASPDDINPLQMRSAAYVMVHPSADDLRKALRDRRQMIGMIDGGTQQYEYNLRVVQQIEAMLRARIADDLAALKLATDK